MEKKTIRRVIVQILTGENQGLSANEIYEKIIQKKLYEFKSNTPISVINGELRKSCVGLNLKKSSAIKAFRSNNVGKYFLALE